MHGQVHGLFLNVMYQLCLPVSVLQLPSSRFEKERDLAYSLPHVSEEGHYAHILLLTTPTYERCMFAHE
jgi:hypothetical protein